MSKIKNRDKSSSAQIGSELSNSKQSAESRQRVWFAYLKKLPQWQIICLLALLALGTLGAALKYLEVPVDRQTGESFSDSEQNSLLRADSFVAAALPTPQLSKEYVYAGSKILAVEDVNAAVAPPSDLAVWRPSSGAWWVMGGQGSQQISQNWGTGGDIAAPGDYDGDGKTDFCVFRPSSGVWYVIRSSDNSTFGYTLGISGDTPAPADYDGDGKTDMAIFRDDTGVWYIAQSSSSSVVSQQFGIDNDTATPADFDGDGRADISIWRNSSATFYVLRSSSGQLQSMPYGQTGDKPICGDYDGDGHADTAVWRASTWYIRQSSNNQTISYTWGNTAWDKAVPNDYDGDGKLDVAVWRAAESAPGAADVGRWFIRNSSTGQARIEQWGIAGDTPVPAFYRR
ncbi:MAG TPA: VCBS repeat-containing protein [Pyrinomonadaceae bacterium]